MNQEERNKIVSFIDKHCVDNYDYEGAMSLTIKQLKERAREQIKEKIRFIASEDRKQYLANKNIHDGLVSDLRDMSEDNEKLRREVVKYREFFFRVKKEAYAAGGGPDDKTNTIKRITMACGDLERGGDRVVVRGGKREKTPPILLPKGWLVDLGNL